MAGLFVTQKVTDWNFHNYLFDMLGEYLATGVKYREKYYKEAEIETPFSKINDSGEKYNSYPLSRMK